MVAMDEDSSKSYIQNLEEYVLDEAKIVTYKWLSRELNLHVNFAKQLLHTFLKQQKKIVHATYLLSGLLKDEITHKVLIVQEEDLEKAKSQFKLLSSEHVYSVQESTKVADLNSLYIIDRYKKDNIHIQRSCNKMSAIRCNEAVERAADEIARLKIEVRTCAASTDIRASQGAKKKTTTEVENENGAVATTSADMVKIDKEEKKDLESESIAALFATQGKKFLKQEVISEKNGAVATTSADMVMTKKEEKKDLKSGSIAALFAAQGMKSLKQEVISEKSKANGKPPTNSKGCIVMFVNRNVEKPKEKSEAQVPVVAKDESSHDELLSDESRTSEGEEVSTKGRGKSEVVQKKKKVSREKHSTDKGHKRKALDDPSSKKRRRIVHVSDSEGSDDGIFGSEDDEAAPNSLLLVPQLASVSLIESDEEMIAPTPQGATKRGRKRERKLKVSTFMDEDGYIVTKRKYVVESCTDSEGEEKKKKMKTEEFNCEKVKEERRSPTSEPPAKKRCSPQKVKQATLMNFFKKK